MRLPQRTPAANPRSSHGADAAPAALLLKAVPQHPLAATWIIVQNRFAV
jgi:hypothetical protein